jgi:glyoxylase-like metal-dependent hydrolase (beta-lactamase superfamily II)
MIRRAGAAEPAPLLTELEEGIVRVTFPLPLGIDHVHAYLLPLGGGGSLLVDTGLGLPGHEERWRRVFEEVGSPRRIFVTHFHPDHVGGAAPAARAADAPVTQGAEDYELCVTVWGGDGAIGELSDAFMHEHGMPAEDTASVRASQDSLLPCVQFFRDPELVSESDEVEGWQVLHLPGHADGHLCLLRDGVLAAGDALLAGITPNVGRWPGGAPDPLGAYIGSLERIQELAPRLALPGHGEPIHDPAGRAAEILEHHEARLARTLALLDGRPRNAYDVSLELFPDALAPPLRRFALAETIAHLEHLELRGRVERRPGGYVLA